MADNQNQIHFNEGNKYDVTLSFDECKSGTKDNGQSWYRYAVKYQGNDAYFFANDYNLHNKLTEYKKGDIVTIEPKYNSGEKYPYEWVVESKGSDGSSSGNNMTNETQIKISVWAGMKVASNVSNNLDELKVNTYLALALHEEICQSVKKEEIITKKEKELF
jgi:hypothetical protein